jgi:hypothetical protein
MNKGSTTSFTGSEGVDIFENDGYRFALMFP